MRTTPQVAIAIITQEVATLPATPTTTPVAKARIETHISHCKKRGLGLLKVSMRGSNSSGDN